MKVTSLGDNLSVVISVERSYAHDWMSFGLWYSLSKNAPDAAVFLRLTGAALADGLFHWPARFGVKVARGALTGNVLVVPPHVLMVRELDEQSLLCLDGQRALSEDLCCGVREPRFAPFVSYEGGCGAFNFAKCINRGECPYDVAEGLMTHGATLNEVKVLQFWAQVSPIYSTIARG